MAWIFLIISGLGEVGGVTFMKLSDGFKRWRGTVGAIIFGFISFYFLSRSLQDIPISTAYGIWTGIGSVGSVVLGMIFFGESRDWRKIFFVLLIIGSVIGLKLVA
ncbi:quaternary ammonium compound-resistance protein SugE [Paenibacillus algorifonticola]|uniref:Quaternary ammonium compound-resistance protein SugE n=1 Tax=Paenibacillus algorifonticola TaxID=684063 RepID=A0A1I2GCQ6_9BACL|nr:multidrug efflux SMR transporter [Paenibacillus algorifonticola]SFF14973.1 quaternary ammonium compound-resistance protein SugE [Paenibacillus algorifonticola]